MADIGFAYPAVLSALIALPLIWWLLRLMPPRPHTEPFPPLSILAQLARKEQTPAQSPWWLTALRLVLTALVIVALARPILNPQQRLAGGDGPVLIMLDNGWSAAPEWTARLRTAQTLLRQAADDGRPVALAPTVANPAIGVRLMEPDAAAEQLAALEPVAAAPDRQGAAERLLAAVNGGKTPATLAIIDTDLADRADPEWERLAADPRLAGVVRLTTKNRPLTVITDAANRAGGFAVTLTRTAAAPAVSTVALFDARERLMGSADAVFDADGLRTELTFDIPFQLRNDIASARADGRSQAGAVWLLDDNDRRRRVAILTGTGGEEAQPLLAPLFYIERALSPFADLIEPRTGDLSVDIPELAAQGPAMIVMADIGVIPQPARPALDAWLDAGGTLVRFAGPRLAASAADDPYLPVTLRAGERALGGTLSWSEPQPVAGFAPGSPFAGLDPPRQVTVTRQILAQPDADLADRTWASLADGTPLVTGARRGQGAVVLFHVAADATWSNLPISGTFVDMLRRITDVSRNTGARPAGTVATLEDGTTLLPLRILRGDGTLTAPPPQVRPLDAQSAAERPDFETPAGLYGTAQGFVARNVLAPGQTLEPLAIAGGGAIVQAPLVTAEQADLSGWLFLSALILLVADTLAVLWINGRFDMWRRPAPATALIVLVAAALALAAPAPSLARDTPVANDAQPGDAGILDALQTTRMAYVLTGDRAVDETSRAGLDGLTRFLASRTAFEPGDAIAVDIERDELAFYPLIYFPISADGPMPSEAAVARLDSYMQNGGTILFDTRDQLTGALTDATTPETVRLRQILHGLNVPPLEPVPPDHVLTKAFYILDHFPGRYAGSPLWVEAEIVGDTPGDRPVRTGDGVTPIMITGNDLAAAWALDEAGRPVKAIASGDPLQRIHAFRTGVNIMMYMLTGNYKADQVHVPALLERLGQ